jgi:cohesin complex subunit SA-1/2
VYTSGESAEDVAGQWLARYKGNNQVALTELINFIFRSAGCSAEVTIDDINDPDNAETRISDMQDELQAVSLAPMPNIERTLISCSNKSQITLLSRKRRAATRSEQL